jgi:hypothetical protein
MHLASFWCLRNMIYQVSHVSSNWNQFQWSILKHDLFDIKYFSLFKFKTVVKAWTGQNLSRTRNANWFERVIVKLPLSIYANIDCLSNVIFQRSPVFIMSYFLNISIFQHFNISRNANWFQWTTKPIFVIWLQSRLALECHLITQGANFQGFQYPSG